MANPQPTWWADDDELMSTLKDALAPVPESFLAAGRAAFAWHNIDAELAALSYDSATDLAGATTRAEPAALRSLTFDTTRLTIELEIIDDVLHGQLVPPQPGRIEVRLAEGEPTVNAVNEVGYFSAALPAQRFRLYCQPAVGSAVLTDWISL
jgi:hypothetical protein